MLLKHATALSILLNHDQVSKRRAVSIDGPEDGKEDETFEARVLNQPADVAATRAVPGTTERHREVLFMPSNKAALTGEPVNLRVCAIERRHFRWQREG